MRQGVFDLPLRAAQGRAAFFVAPANALALAALDDWPRWPSGRLLLTGPAGSGKTHLAHVWAEGAGARVATAAVLDAEAPPALAAGPLALDDAQAVAGNPARETALFHVLNLAAAAGLPVLMTARAPARAWGIGLPDLASRIEASGLARLGPPDDALLAAVMVKLFADRQVHVAPAVIDRLLPRMHRSLAFAGRLVAALDRAALERRRAIDAALADAVLADLTATGLADGGE